MKRVIDRMHSIARTLRESTGLPIGLFILTVLAVTSSIYINASWVDHFKKGAIRFVPAEAVSFMVIPNVRDFMTYALPSIRAIVGTETPSKKPDLMALLAQAVWPQDSKLPTQCTAISDLNDLQQYGIDDRSSFSAARLDAGGRVAVKFTDPTKGLIFLGDELTPRYVELQATNAPTPNEKVSFNLVIDARNIGLCPYDDRRHVVTGKIQLELKDQSAHVYIPIRSNADRTENASLQIACTMTDTAGRVQACDCKLFEYHFSTPEGTQTDKRDCSSTLDLSDRLKNIKRWYKMIDSGETARIGAFYVAEIDEFYVIEKSISSRTTQRYKLSEPLLPLDRDDSILQHFRAFENHGKSFNTTIYAGGRPDWVTEVSRLNLSTFPLYLLTPVAVHFSAEKVELEFVSNLEPQDMAVVQALTQRRPNEALYNLPPAFDGAAVAVADNSLGIYVDALRTYDPAFVNMESAQFPLVPTILDEMEAARSVVVSVIGWNSDAKTWRLMFAVPDVSREYASTLAEIAIRGKLKREGYWIIYQAAQWAKRLGYDPSKADFKDHVLELTCPHPYWTLKSVREVGPKKQRQLFTDLDIADRSLDTDARKWIVTTNGLSIQPIAAPDDANLVLWGSLGADGGFVKSNTDELTAELRQFAHDFEAIGSSIKDSTQSDEILEKIRASLPALIIQGRHLEEQRYAIRQLKLVSYLEAVLHVSDALTAKRKLAVPTDWEQKVIAYAPMRSEDIKTLCNGQHGAASTVPMVYYDGATNTLYGFAQLDDVALWKTKDSGSNTSKYDGKLDVRAVKNDLLELVKKAGDKVSEDSIKAFPFQVLRLNLEGRDSGAGVTGTITLEKRSDAHE